jgi:hypothetical protein
MRNGLAAVVGRKLVWKLVSRLVRQLKPIAPGGVARLVVTLPDLRLGVALAPHAGENHDLRAGGATGPHVLGPPRGCDLERYDVCHQCPRAIGCAKRTRGPLSPDAHANLSGGGE